LNPYDHDGRASVEDIVTTDQAEAEKKAAASAAAEKKAADKSATWDNRRRPR